MGAVLTLDEATIYRETLRNAGKTLVFTNGHFDLLHIGHLDYLEQARGLGNALFVGVNGDGSTRRLKGTGRPLVPAAERARLLAALWPVDAAIVYDPPDSGDEADTMIGIIRALQPEIYVKGGDYAAESHAQAPKPLPERVAVEAYGGRVVLIDYLPGHSTSELIARVRALP